VSHGETWDLIPWLVNGRAHGPERQRAEAHLRECEACRTELDTQQRLQAAMAQEASLDLLPAASLQRLHAKLDAQAATGARPQRAARSRSKLRWLVAAVVVESIGLMFMSAALWRQDVPSAPYRTVTSAMVGSSASIRAVFAPQLPVHELQTLLETSHLKIVAGPSEAGVYSLALPSAAGPRAIESALATLRAHPGVRFAEPITAGRQ
jgi:predicted anti-sigma-YlaC factor YlaD